MGIKQWLYCLSLSKQITHINSFQDATVYILSIRIFSRGFYFRETSHMRSVMKVKSSRNGEFTLSFTDISKSRPSRNLFTSQICLTLFTKIKFSRKFPNLQCTVKSKCKLSPKEVAVIKAMLSHVQGDKIP